MGGSIASVLSSVQPDQFVWITGYPTETRTKWHVNKAITIQGGKSQRRLAVVLQLSDASPHWIVAILGETDTGWNTLELTAFEDSAPRFDANGDGEPLDPENVTIVNITTE